MRQECRPFLIVHPDRNLIPYVNQEYRIAITFDIQSVANSPTDAKEIILQAPKGYSFGAEGSNCEIYEHNLLPYFNGCKVGHDLRGANEVVLSLLTKMPSDSKHGAPIHYRFMIDVVNADCDNDDWAVDSSMVNIFCRPKETDNEWLIDFGGNAKWKATGYQLYVPVTVGAESFHFQDQFGCSGQVRLAKGEDNYCMDVTGQKFDKGSTLHVGPCPLVRPEHEEEETTSWIAPPTGAGPLRLRFHYERCACIATGDEEGDLKVGMVIKLMDCSGDLSEKCQWIMPSSTFGTIRSGKDPRFCLGYTKEEDEEGRSDLQLIHCRHEPRTKWLTPCPGIDAVNNPRQIPGSASLTMKARPNFCSRNSFRECGPGRYCNERDGICEVIRETEETDFF